MKIISPAVHAVLDYATGMLLLIVPRFLDLSPALVYISYAAALFHFLLTLLTKFKGGMMRVIPFPLHGLIEFSEAIVYLIIGIVMQGSGKHAFIYFGSVCILYIIVFIFTDYKNVPADKNSQTGITY